jgi:tetratricopeptide (TPR) repeat protein
MMGLFKKLFSSKDKERTTDQAEPPSLNKREEETMKIQNMLTGEILEAELNGGSLAIHKLNYHGEFHRSENGRFILSWSDMDLEACRTWAGEIRAGSREKGHGGYLLLDEDKIILQGKLERPNDGKVSDQGVFILNDWMFKVEQIGTFYAFKPNGQKLIQHKFNANLYNNGLSKNGKFAVCQTANSDNEDGNKLSFFDLDKQKLMWKIEPIPQWANNYGFDVEKEILSLFYENGRTYRYDFNGNFLDSEKWEKEQFESANGYELFEMAMEKKEELKSRIANLSTYNEFISLMKKALEKGVSEYYQSLIHRELGETYQKIGILAEAIYHFEKAISLNPKIGVKKVLKSLKN